MNNELSTQNKDLINTSDLPDEVKKLMAEEGINVSVGEIYIDANNSRTRVVRISKIEIYNECLSFEYETPEDWDATEWSRESTLVAGDFKRAGKYIKLTKSYAEYRAEAADVISGKITIDELSIDDNESDANETSLISKGSKEGLIAIQKDMELKKNRVEMIKAFVALEMEKRKQELDNVRRKLEGVLEVFQKQITRIMRVITTIELYLGINEEIVQIQDGEKAPENTPITFRQKVLYMDEEVATTENDGLDFKDVDIFDGWLMENSNYKTLLPEPKGVIVFRPRRNMKDYGDSQTNAILNQENKLTYLLIRNGDCLYRIYSEKIVIQPRLFPQRNELMDLLNEIKETESRYQKEEGEEKIEGLMYQYKKRAVLLQGLIDRTEILHPMPPNLSIFKMDEAGDMFNFVYDDEVTLPDGRLRFHEFVKESNDKICHGSRIIVTGDYRNYQRDSRYGTPFNSDRIFIRVNEHNAPSPPQKGLYEVEKYMEIMTEKVASSKIKEYTENTEEYPNLVIFNKYMCRGGYEISEIRYDVKEHLTIMHNPNDTIYSGWHRDSDSRERKNRIRFKINQNDSFVLNYDQISLDDINFYLTNRVDRENYLEMMPLLRTLKKWRLGELESEKFFAGMVMQQINSTTLKKPIIDLWVKIWGAIEWWKFKNMIKRPIDKDDSKALRMIMKKLISDNK